MGGRGIRFGIEGSGGDASGSGTKGSDSMLVGKGEGDDIEGDDIEGVGDVLYTCISSI